MLPSTGYFKTMSCPFFEMGFCERPFCHFKHRKKEDPPSIVPVPCKSDASPALTEEYMEQPKPSVLKASLPCFDHDEFIFIYLKEIKEERDVKPPIAGPSASRDVPAPIVEAAGTDLQHLVEEAVKKVLLQGGVDPSKLLNKVETSSIISQIKKEKHESDDDVCIIEDEPTADQGMEAETGQLKSPSKHKLYLPPANCPQYKPTPIKDLQKKPAGQENVLGDIGDLSESDEETPDLLGKTRAVGSLFYFVFYFFTLQEIF